MNNQDFLIEMENSINRTKRTLNKKKEEYSQDDSDRLEQFYRAAAAQSINPCEALLGMATKHFTSIADMVKDPTKYSLKKWNEKIGDLRNYTILLDALIRDTGVK